MLVKTWRNVNPCTLSVEMKTSIAIIGNNMAIHQEIVSKTAIDVAIPMLCIYNRKRSHYFKELSILPCLCSIIHNSHSMETT